MIAALSFLTVFGRGSRPDDRTLRWFPPVGALIGLAVGGVWWAASQAFDPLLAACLVVAADLAITGMLHLDGVADSADGLLPHLPKERRLAVMAEPTAGAFAVVTVAMVLVLRTAAFAGAAVDAVAIAGIWCASRSLMAVIATSLPYARPGGGLASAFTGGTSRGWGRLAPVLGVVAGSAALVATAGWAGAGGSAGLLAGTGAVVALARQRLGGFTGDVLGAAGVLGETAALVVLAARW